MSDPAVRVENLGKRFELGQIGSATDIVRSARKVKRRLTRTRPEDLDPVRPWRYDDADNAFWALKDISFEVEHGEVLGIIGGNGAGKSTLLKILSRITAPTAGRVELYGRLASLLEVGTGFHQELTGRENVYLNGAILGMNKREVDAKFDEIVDFAGVEKFIDTPVKRYSSGMKVRLGFAVAAHLEPEILMIDEVLAVGDIEFQKRCLGKMRDVATSGRTVFFVSHKMSSVEQLCDRTILLDHGEIADDGDPSRVIHEYARKQSEKRRDTDAPVNKFPGADLQLVKAELLDASGEPTGAVRFREPFSIRLAWYHSGVHLGCIYNAICLNDFDEIMFAANTQINPEVSHNAHDHNIVECHVLDNVLVPGNYRIDSASFLPDIKLLQRAEGCIKFTVTDVPWDSAHPLKSTRSAKFVPRYSWNRSVGVEYAVSSSPL